MRRTWAAAALGLACAAAAQGEVPLYKSAAAPVEARVADLLARMTPEEKLAELAQGASARPPGPARASRLGIPVLVYEGEAPGSVFPQPLALAASFDPGLVREVHAARGQAVRARGGHLARAPSLDIGRDPRRGRLEHTFGEDPYLVGEMGVAAVEGLQGSGKLLAAVGHVAGPALPAEGSGVGPAPVSERELRETYFPPFEEVLKRASPGAVVVSRYEIDGVPAHANKWLLQDVVRREWGFTGAVFGETGGVGDLHSLYRVAASPAAAAALALSSGVDAGFGAEIRAAGGIGQARIDAAVARLLALKFRAGLFDKAAAPAPDARANALALKAAQRSIVLLKNDGVLPLEGSTKVAVLEIGAAGPLRERLRATLRTRVQLVDTARQADQVVLVLAEGARDAPEKLDGLRALGKSIVVVLAGERPHASVKVAEIANALVGAWALGEQGGRAVAEVLLGDVNPGGRLPVTLARSAGQLPLFYNAKPSARRGYLFESSDPLFAFGSGLGYTRFELGAPRLSTDTIGADGAVQVAVEVRNVGKRAGEETVQLYVRDKVGSVTRPVKQLKGFARVSLQPGETRTVALTLPATSLAMWDERMRRVVEPGEFEVMTGASSAQLQSTTLTVGPK